MFKSSVSALLFCSVIATSFINTNVNAQSISKTKENSVESIQSVALDLYTSLNQGQRNQAYIKYDSKSEKVWRYFPKSKVSSIFPDHAGIELKKLNEIQQEKVIKLISTILSEEGTKHVDIARTQDSDTNIKRKLEEKALFYYGKEYYNIAFFGLPTDKKWALRFEGHHVSINVNVEDGKVVSAAPLFLGINPSTYTHEGQQVVIHENVTTMVKYLNNDLTDSQLSIANSSLSEIPKDLLFTPTLVQGKTQLPKGALPSGLSYSNMSSNQKAKIVAILKYYFNHLNPSLSAMTFQKILDSGLENLEYSFVGDKELVNKYYFRIQGPTFVLEFITADNNPNHYHVAFQER